MYIIVYTDIHSQHTHEQRVILTRCTPFFLLRDKKQTPTGVNGLTKRQNWWQHETHNHWNLLNLDPIILQVIIKRSVFLSIL